MYKRQLLSHLRAEADDLELYIRSLCDLIQGQIDSRRGGYVSQLHKADLEHAGREVMGKIKGFCFPMRIIAGSRSSDGILDLGFPASKAGSGL